MSDVHEQAPDTQHIIDCLSQGTAPIRRVSRYLAHMNNSTHDDSHTQALLSSLVQEGKVIVHVRPVRVGGVVRDVTFYSLLPLK